MSRIYVLQAPRLAVAAARMKADVNFLGAVDKMTLQWMENNHVFLRDVWQDGEVTVRRLQRLNHQLFPGNNLIMDMSLSEPLLLKAIAYAQERKARVILFVKDGEKVDQNVSETVDLLINRGGEIIGKPKEIIHLQPDDNAEAVVGAMALCVMNGLNTQQAESFFKRAAAFSDLPWYDEVAYAD
jgi:hypothetical protein